MSITLSSASLPVFTQFLGNLKHLLTKAQADVAARGYDEQALVQYRLAPDMFPLTRQVQIATDMAKGCVIDKETGEVIKYGDKAEEAARRFIEAALAGDKQTVEALAKLIERTDGPVRQEIDVSAEVTTKRVVLEREPPQ